MKHPRFLLFLLMTVCISIASFTAVRVVIAHQQSAEASVVKEEVPSDRPVEEIVKFLAPMNQLTLYPCSSCHNETNQKPNPQRRVLATPHDIIPVPFANHDSQNLWCTDCHTDTSLDQFHLLSGQLVAFDQYYRVCEQCHKRVYRDWKMGEHGKRTGSWSGEKQWMHCTQCHNPHDPPFQAIAPMPAPRSPLGVRVAAAAEAAPPAAKPAQ
jgi:hypothetical protein